MSKEIKLAVQKRHDVGSSACRRLRSQGAIPGNVYGHGIDPVAIVVSEEVLRPIVQSGAHMLDVDVEGQVEKAVLREIQWDTFGIRIQHFDLMRVDVHEMVTVDVPIELRGTPKGVDEGGMLEQPIHTLTIDCPAAQIPDAIVVKVQQLQIGGSIHVSDLELPEKATCELPPETVVAHVITLKVAAEEEEAEEGPAEPEVIGRHEEEVDAGD